MGVLQSIPALEDLHAWCVDALPRAPAVRSVIAIVLQDVEAFVSWPSESLLLWRDCIRIAGMKHSYPHDIRVAHRTKIGSYPDPRENGPAIAAFRLAGGLRPARASGNGWNIHHIYDGKYPYPGRTSTVRAVKHGEHFTQSAGLVAVHPIADALADEDVAFAWFLRASSYIRFRYDPDGVFSSVVEEGGPPAAG